MRADNELVTQQDGTVTDNQPESDTALENTEQIAEASQDEKDSSEVNFKALREKADAAGRERDEYKRILLELEARAQYYQAQQSQNQKQDDVVTDPDDEDIVDGKQYKKLAQKTRQLEAKIEETTVESKLRNRFNDFDQIISKENIEALKQSEPELAESLHRNPDLYSKAVATYKAIKRMNIQPDKSYDADKELAQKNAAKPKPLSSVSPQQGQTPLSRANAFANGLTPELKEQLLKEMSQSRKSY